MATSLLVRGLDEALVEALKQRAARHQRSVEEEHRRILKKALGPKRQVPPFTQHLLNIPASPGPEFDDVFEMPRVDAPRPDPFGEDE